MRDATSRGSHLISPLTPAQEGVCTLKGAKLGGTFGLIGSETGRNSPLFCHSSHGNFEVMTELTSCSPRQKRLSGVAILIFALNWIRAPLAGIFILLEPLVTGVLTTLGTLGLLAAALFSAALPNRKRLGNHILFA